MADNGPLVLHDTRVAGAQRSVRLEEVPQVAVGRELHDDVQWTCRAGHSGLWGLLAKGYTTSISLSLLPPPSLIPSSLSSPLSLLPSLSPPPPPLVIPSPLSLLPLPLSSPPPPPLSSAPLSLSSPPPLSLSHPLPPSPPPSLSPPLSFPPPPFIPSPPSLLPTLSSPPPVSAHPLCLPSFLFLCLTNQPQSRYFFLLVPRRRRFTNHLLPLSTNPLQEIPRL